MVDSGFYEKKGQELGKFLDEKFWLMARYQHCHKGIQSFLEQYRRKDGIYEIPEELLTICFF